MVATFVNETDFRRRFRFERWGFSVELESEDFLISALGFKRRHLMIKSPKILVCNISFKTDHLSVPNFCHAPSRCRCSNGGRLLTWQCCRGVFEWSRRLGFLHQQRSRFLSDDKGLETSMRQRKGKRVLIVTWMSASPDRSARFSACRDSPQSALGVDEFVQELVSFALAAKTHNVRVV